MEKKLNILKLIDQYGWAYDFTSREMKKYSKHNIIIKKALCNYEIEKGDEIDLTNVDLVYIPSPDIHPYARKTLPLECKKRNIPIIGGYSAEITVKYEYADLILAISANFIDNLKKMYPDKPVIFLPEGIDTKFFIPHKLYKNNFKVGWAGSYTRPLKRTHLLEELDYKVKVKCDRTFFSKKTLQPMKDFYRSLDCLVLLSTTECMPRVVLEAMASGLPIISTAVGSIKMLLNSKWIVPIFPEKEVIKQINQRLHLLKEYISLRREISKENRKTIEKYFSWDKIQPLWDDIFEKVVNKEFNLAIKTFEEWFKPYKKFYEIKKELKKGIKITNAVENLKANKDNKQIEKIKIEIEPKNVEFEPVTSTEIESKEMVISSLRALGIDFYVLDKTCLETINKGLLKEDDSPISLGVNNKKDEEEILKFIKNLKTKKFKIIIKQTEKISTKVMPLYGIPIKVPFPVVRYLENIFGKGCIKTK